MYDVYDESCFWFKEGLQIGLIGICNDEPEAKRQTMLWKHWLFGKENVPGSTIDKEGEADCLLGDVRNYHH